MLNVGAAEILVIGLVALIVVGPEQLPGLIRRVGQVVGQVRSVTENLKKDFMDTVDESGDLKKTMDPKSWTTGAGTKDDPVVPRGLAEKKKETEAAAKKADSNGSTPSTTVGKPFNSDSDKSSSVDSEGEPQS